MNDLVRDTFWFTTPTGGEIKITLPGHTAEEVTSFKKKLEDAGFVVVSHETHVTKDKKWELPAWVAPLLIGFALGMYVYAGWLRFL